MGDYAIEYLDRGTDRLAVHVYPDGGGPVALVLPAMGVPARYYRPFAGHLRDYLFDHLRSADSLTRRYYNTAVLDRVLDEHTRGVQAHDKLLWTLLTLEIWHRQYCSRATQEEPIACAA